MPFVPKSEGRSYSVFPAANTPQPLALNGKLYGKTVAGQVQLFFLSDNGTEYQITPGGAVAYPFELPETATPAPLANTGKLYSKDVAGVSQLFFLADDGTETQLTPVSSSGAPERVFIYDLDEVAPSGNVYNDMVVLLAAAALVDGPKTIKVMNSLVSGRLPPATYDFYDCEMVFGGGLGTGDSASLTFDSGSLIPNLPYRLQSVSLNFDCGFPVDTNTPMLVIGPTETRSIILEGFSLLIGSGPALGGGSAIEVNGLLEVYVNDNSGMQGFNSGTSWRAFAGTGQINVMLSCSGQQSGIQGQAAALIGGDLTCRFYGQGPLMAPYLITGSTVQPEYFRTYDATVPQNSLYQSYTPAAFAAQQNDYAPIGLVAADTLRISSTGAQNISGFSSAISSFAINSGLAAQTRKLINVGASNITLLHDNAASSAFNRILTNTGASLVLGPNNWCWIWYDTVSQRWRAKL